jgi:hypothetical protein
MTLPPELQKIRHSGQFDDDQVCTSLSCSKKNTLLRSFFLVSLAGKQTQDLFRQLSFMSLTSLLSYIGYSKH